jgi:hypothetical protein
MTVYHPIRSNTSGNEKCKNYCRVTYYFEFTLATACIWHNFYLENLHFTARFQSQLIPKSANRIRVTIFKNLRENKIKVPAVTTKNLTNNFTGLVKRSIGLDMARGPPVCSHVFNSQE